MTDYFECSRARLTADSPYFAAAMQANAKSIARGIKRATKAGRTHSAEIYARDLEAVEAALAPVGEAASLHMDFLASIGA